MGIAHEQGHMDKMIKAYPTYGSGHDTLNKSEFVYPNANDDSKETNTHECRGVRIFYNA